MLLLLFLPDVYAREIIKGRVETGDVYVKLSRPARTSTAATAASRQEPSGAFDSPGAKASIDCRDFLLGGKASELAGDDEGLPGKSKPGSEMGVDGENKELVIAWERWHKAVAAAIYSRWRTYGTIPGEEKVKMTFTRKGEIGAEFPDRNAFSEIYDEDEQDRKAFEENVSRTLRSLNHDPVLAFPEKSQRQKVVLQSLFYSHWGHGPSGYSWKRGDYEHVKVQGGR